MLSHSEAEKILGDWIVYVTEHDLIEKKKEFWLLYDYLEEDFPEQYYRKHYEEAKKILALLDDSKDTVQSVKEYLESIIDKYEKGGFFAI